VSPLRHALDEQIDIYTPDAAREARDEKDGDGDVSMSDVSTGSASVTAGTSIFATPRSLDPKRLTLQTPAMASTSVFGVQPVLSEVRSTAARSKDAKRRKKGYVDLLRRLDGGYFGAESSVDPDEMEGVAF